MSQARGQGGEVRKGMGKGESGNVGTSDFALRWEALNGFGLVFLIDSFCGEIYKT